MTTNLEPFFLHKPQKNPLPIVISCPHVGTEIPSAIANRMTLAARQNPDTDWFVHDLYRFAPAMGIHLLQARFSRFVIDLNRDPAGTRLYDDKRHETTLVPTKTFEQHSIYNDSPPDQDEINSRIKFYFEPYHQKLSILLQDLRKIYRHVLLIDAHSIRRIVPSIRLEPFADIILGDQVGKTADPSISTSAIKALSNFDTKYNDPFMGGYITRFFGNPKNGIHALQIEMSQDIYMDDATCQRNQHKEKSLQLHLENLLLSLNHVIESL